MSEPEAGPLSRNAAAALALLLGVCLLLPFPASWGARHGREGLYRNAPTALGPLPAMERQIFQEHGDIDVLVVGDSLLLQAIDVPRLQAALSGDLGRPARVFSFCTNWAGLDRHFVLLQDLLARRRVRMVVFDMPTPARPFEDKLHVQSHFWLRLGDDPDLFRGLSLRDRAAVYSVLVLGAPRQILSRLRPDRIDPSQTDPALLTGVEDRYGFNGAPFVALPPRDPAVSALDSRTGWAGFRFTGPPLGSLQRHYAERIAGLLRQYRVRGVIVHVPIYSERHGTTVDERECWPEALDPALTLVGVQPGGLFQGLGEEQIQHYYYNEHFNQNGKRLFTQVLLPTLRKLYGETASGS